MSFCKFGSSHFIKGEFEVYYISVINNIGVHCEYFAEIQVLTHHSFWT